ncbi:hypothetical protein ACN9MB_13200 [Dyella kyungheensis]|uniref:hypothetical protein n=1 Tax=Dyella kyungheensis TaxID=1242174 RepID=UPI003CF77A37
MNGLRFREGDLARLVVARTSHSIQYLGQVMTVFAVGPFKDGHEFPSLPGHKRGIARADGDYGLLLDRDTGFMAYDWKLAKVDPPAEPESLTRREECEA